MARIALRDQQHLPRVDASLLDDELKLLADAREQLIVEAGRGRNRAHALLRVAAPGTRPARGRSPRRAPSAARERSPAGPCPTTPRAPGWPWPPSIA